MTILEAIKKYRGSAFKLLNYGVAGHTKWLIWDATNNQFVVYSNDEPEDLGIEIYRGTSESDAVAVLTDGTGKNFINRDLLFIGCNPGLMDF